MRAQQLLKSLALLCLFAIAGFSAFAQKVIPIDTSKVMTLRVDPINANGGNASEVFESVTYIPLETTKESTFGKVDQLEITDEYYIILDKTTNSILIFKKDGKFHGKIKGGSFTLTNIDNRMDNFKINKWTREIMFSRWDVKTSQQTHCFFNYDGKKTREILSRDKELIIYNGRFVSKDLMILAENYDDDKKNGVKTKYLMEYANDFKKPKTFAFPYQAEGLSISEEVMSAGSGPFYNYGVDSAVFFVKPYDYNIYKAAPNTLKHAYRFLFPLVNSLPKDFLFNNEYKGKRFKYLQDNPDAIFALSNCFQVGDNLVFKANCFNNDFNKQASMIYNLKSGSLIALGHITTDAMSYFLPVADDRMTGYTGFVASDGKYLYSSFSSVYMFQTHEENKDKNVKYNRVLIDYFGKGSGENNPVLVQIKLKDDL
ncbi:6-bladed beta-propeller [Pedobacter foliorum]|uniref:6-bladed beta-propeller n=1 Tax=Pedobacter foliorum TaxID=2739058 RepID=UPI001563EDB1|nr:6-bladed beta-propeller [Pedobacter foliorum]NRF40945.1 6-bladed beta-propeller [Pedobacter foliorum]